MKDRMPRQLSRRAFLGTTGKLALGVTAALTGTTGLFYYGAKTHKSEAEAEQRPGNIADLGSYEELAALTEMKKIHYEAEYVDAWYTKPLRGFVYVTKDQNGEILILSPACTHLGCSVEPATTGQREKTKNLVLFCPCHGAEFGKYGETVSTVVPRGLDTFKPIIAGGRVYFDAMQPIQRSEST
ncbi:ubiquinol-cytochrome c reductase iron-sulfur subunit [Paenibacillus sp. OV219]|uniref:QcrA and Rieske domain-containing protein n=1 Tax=Paenibacillus sp. OV219 TaxID=1884377 RepID=UPI0008D657EF|nr:Rieske 2Fe-2S domain-containing protein [Paenibacillus sp. OV219]SEO94463.1 menaquinol-cytochrome c reductase iron-sulfur subunit [Paenibacillus sp. OV219]